MLSMLFGFGTALLTLASGYWAFTELSRPAHHRDQWQQRNGPQSLVCVALTTVLLGITIDLLANGGTVIQRFLNH